MYYDLIAELVSLVKDYESESGKSGQDLHKFGAWLHGRLEFSPSDRVNEPEWIGKEKGRSADSVINTSLVHLYRYAKLHAKSAIAGTSFSTPDDFIYLICLVSLGSMTKSALIRMNVHEKSVGMQIVNRLISNGLVTQEALASDKRNRIIHITEQGKALLNTNMHNIRKASFHVTEPLSAVEKKELIRLLKKLEDFHELKAKKEL